MATYIRIFPDFETNPKTIKLIGRLGRGSEILLVRLWLHASQHHWKDGFLKGYSVQSLENVLKWWGKGGHAEEALLETDFIEKLEDGYKIRDWENAFGHISGFKEKARKGGLALWHRRSLEHAPSMPDASQAEGDSHAQN